MPKYAEDPLWADVEPLQQDSGGPYPLAAISYSEEYSEAMAYLRAIMAKGDLSERVLELTEDIIQMNPAHYTVWLYRAKIILKNDISLRNELQWLNKTALQHQKNYQIWQHRQIIVDRIDDASGESDFLAQMFEADAKNYHVWSYRQWLVRRFDLWEQGELEETERFISEDVRNNSAWNHRWFVVFGRPGGVDEGTVHREIEYILYEHWACSGINADDLPNRFAKDAIRRAPQNQSPWNYARGILRHRQMPLYTLESFASEFAPIENPEDIRSSHALDLLADINADKSNGSGKDSAFKAWDMLATKFDPVRQNYWNYRKERLQQTLLT